MLLAFGEYIPFLETFPFLEAWLPETISHFTRGKEKPVFSIGEKIHWLPLICYEDLSTDFVRGFDLDDADFFVNVTNDGWFGKSAASFLHMQQARARCVEYRKPMVRALNTGTSVAIDAAGRTISKETDLYVRDFINTTFQLPQTPPRTIYSLIGNWPGYIAIVVVTLLWLQQTITRRSARS
jgi:apolipoprotein N-acyltransferase